VAAAATPAIGVLMREGVPHEVIRYQHDPRVQSFGDEAAQELAARCGAVAEQVLKTLVIAGRSGLAVAVIPVPWKLSLKSAAAALGWPKADMADPRAAQRSSGYIVGGISPLGQRKKLPTVIDQSVVCFDRILFSAGKRGWDVTVAPQDLIRLTDAKLADLRLV
jgi:Cys-tRNA(Pro)/Cys-tRNA(Cys) deacylase